MRLRSLRLRNYRRFRDATLEFPEGVIAITGPNGAGKSTLIESVTWCLFGHDAARTQKELLKRTGAAAGEDVEVRLEFELDGAAYAVSRRLRGKSQQSEAQVEIDGALVVAPGANSSELTSKRLSKALGMDRRGFQATVVANQGDLSALSDTHPGERKRLILGLLGVDAIDEAIAAVRTAKREGMIRLEETRRLVVRAADLRLRRSGLIDEVTKAVTLRGDAERDASQRATHAGQLQTHADALGHARQRHRDLRSRLDGLQRALQAHHDQAVRVGSELQLIEQRGHDLSRLQADGAQWSDLDERLARFAAESERRALRLRLESERAALDEDLLRWSTEASTFTVRPTDAALEDEIVRLRADLESATVQLTQVDAHAQHLETDRRRLQSDALERGDQWRDLKTLGPDAVCPMCERTLGEAAERITAAAVAHQTELRTRVERIQTEHASLRTQASVLRREQDAARTRLVERERELETVRRAQERARLAKTEGDRLRARRIQVEQRLDALPADSGTLLDPAALERDRGARDRWRQQVARLETEVARSPRLKAELATLAAEAEATRREIETASRELSKTPYVEGTWEAAQRAAEVERNLQHDAERRRDVLAERIAGQRAQIEVVDRDLSALADVEAQMAVLEDRVRIAEALAADRGDLGVLPEFRSHIIGRVRPALARAAGDLMSEMTNARYTELVIEDDYAFRVYDGGHAWPVERFSGGEVDIINLAVRLAVSELLARARRASRLQFVALDEVLAAQDESRRRNVLQSLKTLGRHFRQVLLVTHLDEVRERVDHVVRVVPSVDGTSRFETSWTETSA